MTPSFRFLVLALALTIYGGLSSQALANDTAKPSVSVPASPQTASDMVQSLGDRALSILADKSKTAVDRRDLFHTLLRDNFDLPIIGRFVLGNYWHQATPEQQQEYLRLFESLVIGIYSDRFELYSGEKFRVVTSRAESERDFIVTSDIVHPNGTSIAVDWRLRAHEGQPVKIVDVSVEGVSMSVSQRSEFASVIQRAGGQIDGLLKILRERVAAKEN